MDIERLRAIQIGFISEILRLLSHDLKNDLSIIKESAGFIEDLITFKGQEINKYLNKQLESIKLINDTVFLTDQKIKALNKFAHLMHNNLAEFNLNETLSDFIYLISKSLKRGKITLNQKFDGQIILYNSPFFLLYIIYKLIFNIKENFPYELSIDIFSSSLDQNTIKIILITNSFEENVVLNKNITAIIETEILDIMNLNISIHEQKIIEILLKNIKS